MKDPTIEKAKLEELMKLADTICPYSRAIHGNVDVKLSVRLIQAKRRNNGINGMELDFLEWKVPAFRYSVLNLVTKEEND